MPTLVGSRARKLSASSSTSAAGGYGASRIAAAETAIQRASAKMNAAVRPKGARRRAPRPGPASVVVDMLEHRRARVDRDEEVMQLRDQASA